ncbi:methylmalonyl-CoA epimerase [Granulosicoccus sp. 3-233]|uniref:methylmalonyl-CoA epimerase n=1 Tax=Granulosicoccus sp. 3-233 TaxID=3417969 RepID=UPI003D34D256
MIGRLNHVALVVADLDAACSSWQHMLGAQLSEPQALPEHGVTVVFIDLPNTRIELLEPLGDGSPVSRFLEKHVGGGMHHICLEVEDIVEARDDLIAKGARILGNGEPKIGAHGNPVLFMHPGDFHGTLIELEEVKPEA